MRKKVKKASAALLLGLLAVGGGVLAMPSLSAAQSQVQENIRQFEKNPDRFLQTEDLGLREGFARTDLSYNPEEEGYAINEEALKKSLEAGDYESWKDAMQNLEGSQAYTDVITEEDFKILASLNKLKIDEDSKESQ